MKQTLLLLTRRQSVFHKPRLLFSSRSKSSSNGIIPEPTWSLKELALSPKNNKRGSKKQLITDDELEILSKRCLIDISNMKDKEREELRTELENMMQCISMVTSYQPKKSSSLTQNRELKEALMYDVPRGLNSKQSFPTRNDNKDKDALSWRDEGPMDEMKSILDHLKSEGKLIQHDPESEITGKENNSGDDKWYFATTAISKENKSD